MLISEYISKDFPAFEVDSSAEEALEIASEFGFTHVFVQKNNLFLGGICKEFLEENPDKNLGCRLQTKSARSTPCFLLFQVIEPVIETLLRDAILSAIQLDPPEFLFL